MQQGRYFEYTVVIMLSLVVIFSASSLKLLNLTRNECQNVLYHICFRTDLSTKMGVLAFDWMGRPDWLGYSQNFLCNSSTDIGETLQEASIQNLVFFSRSVNKDYSRGLGLAEPFSTVLQPFNLFYQVFSILCQVCAFCGDPLTKVTALDFGWQRYI